MIREQSNEETLLLTNEKGINLHGYTNRASDKHTFATATLGNLHWLIQAVHLLIGIGAMYLALGLEKRYQLLSLEEGSRARPEAIALQDMG